MQLICWIQCCCPRDHGLGLEAKSAGLGLELSGLDTYGLGLLTAGVGLGLAFKLGLAY